MPKKEPPRPPDIEQLRASIAWLEKNEPPVKGWSSPPQLPYPYYVDEVDALIAWARHPFWMDPDYLKRRPDPLTADAIASADLATLRAIMTWFVRGERFCDGHWAALIERGTALAIFRRAFAILATSDSKP